MQDPQQAYADQRVLVTGASGFIGARLAVRLLEFGAEVHGVSRAPREGDGLVWHALDLADEAAVRPLVERVAPQRIFHLASYVSGSRELDAVLPAFRANLESTVHLLTAATSAGCERIVLTGSLEEPEDVEAPPASPYAAAKGAAASYARMFHALYGTPVVLARLFMVYGPGQKDLNKLIPYVVRTLAAGEEVKLSSGTRPVDWVEVDDVVEGLLRLGAAPGIEGRRIDLGSGELHTVREVVERLYSILAPEASPSFGGIADRPLEQIRRADVEATQALLGWRPSTSLDEGLRRAAEYYRRL